MMFMAPNAHDCRDVLASSLRSNANFDVLRTGQFSLQHTEEVESEALRSKASFL